MKKLTVLLGLAVALIGLGLAFADPGTGGLLMALGGGAVVGMAFLDGEPILQYLKTVGVVGPSNHLAHTRRVVAKVADYTIDPAVDTSGTTFTNRGAAGAVNFTLPIPRASLAGFNYRFKAHADQNIVVVAGAADTLVALNDAAADSLALSTAAQKIGGEIEAFCDGTQWFASVISVGHAGTVAT